MSGAPDAPDGTGRVPVAKTYKLFIDGAFVRSEGGKVLTQAEASGGPGGHVARGTRKDTREAIAAARRALPGWSGYHALLRGQILFRLAEMLEDRRVLFEQSLVRWQGLAPADAAAETATAIERTFWYAGWTDKFGTVLGNVNPVSGPYFNFTVPDPMGVVGIVAPRNSALLGLLSGIAPVIASGNTCVVVVDNAAPTVSIDLAEAIANSDVPKGVVNVLTGRRDELVPTVASHMDVDAVACFGGDDEELLALRTAAADNLKRVKVLDDPAPEDWRADTMQSPYWIDAFVEWKTAWHPIGT